MKQARANGAPILRLHPDQFRQTVLYTGVTNDLLRRIGEHRAVNFPGFTARYNVEVNDAIGREK